MTAALGGRLDYPATAAWPLQESADKSVYSSASRAWITPTFIDRRKAMAAPNEGPAAEIAPAIGHHVYTISSVKYFGNTIATNHLAP